VANQSWLGGREGGETAKTWTNITGIINLSYLTDRFLIHKNNLGNVSTA
jgi:hypothetical protein